MNHRPPRRTQLAAADNSSAAYGVLLLGAVAGFAWLVTTSILVARILAPNSGRSVLVRRSRKVTV
jgi:hypothetical protein